ncbi:VIRB2-interacting protein 2 [Prunus dulcis]|uniref:Reticulon-like protein n=1 Tax=Prunus dulcis TaxID=3755 RepID=A0A4Y1QRK5_PRUDU|nr:VIRB2-interacting protein 2 [Prunus dulcis]
MKGSSKHCCKLRRSDIEQNHINQPTMSMRQRPPHAIFGGGKVADILLWKDKTSAATILAVFTIIWLQLEILEYQFLTVFCDILMLAMLAIFVWHKGAQLANLRKRLETPSFGILLLGTLPALYERYGVPSQVDTFAAKCIQEVKKLFQMFESKVLNKIPGMGKERVN